MSEQLTIVKQKNKLDLNVQKSVKQAIQFIKDCPFKGTAIKVELEAQLNRNYDEYDEDEYCHNCDGEGYFYCGGCTDATVTRTINGRTQRINRETRRDGTPRMTTLVCHECDDLGRVDCDSCNGSGEAQDSGEGWDNTACKDWLLQNVSAEARDALVYSKFYNDGSVDSEFTFTVMIDNAWVVPEFIKAFKNLSKAIGNGLSTSGAGMHISVLNSTSGNYPSGNTTRSTYFENFARTLQPLLFGLYFLSSCSHDSRGLGYRMPEISGDKYSAINNQHGLEYRCFETCYDRPNAFLDYLCVIANTLKFYTLAPVKLPFFGKIGELGVKDGSGLSRFYFTTKHLQALKESLKILKPEYKSIQQLYRERSFDATPKKLKADEKKELIKWKQEWKEFKQRQAVSLRQVVDRAKAEYASVLSAYSSEERIISELGSEAEFVKKQVDHHVKSTPTNQKNYLAQKLHQKATYDVRRTILV